ncbi:GNAT family N-acetyltransferase [Telluribacter sp.]|jgi:ribosomal protein S18 acetylase RimI-like enzyme|uniref:GNAT family N-acetyltransferase n=1 Tax=Telluribacter sp. TaxID=1978767 RepID=UPI002E10DE30|nr:GNAT family N-acetyltransferase [Telluribacter sp.]
MEIACCSATDADAILKLYEAARNLQTARNVVVWPAFSKEFIEAEIAEKRQWKLVIGEEIACNWVITYEDKDIWEEKEKGDAIYIHRIATNPHFQGNRFITPLVDWARNHARENQKTYIRLDTLGNNTRLIQHYTSAGFTFLGIVQLKDTTQLPAHYQHEPKCCLFEIPL